MLVMRQAIIASFLTHEMNLVLILCTFCYSQAQATLKTLIYKITYNTNCIQINNSFD